MIYSYAIDPSVFVSIDRYKRVMDACGVPKGRMLLGLPDCDSWKSQVRSTAEKAIKKPVQRKAILEHIAKKAKKALLSPPEVVTFKSNASFAYNSLCVFADRLHAVVTERNPGEKDCPSEKVILWDEFDDDHRLWHVDTQVDVPAQAQAMAEHVSSLLKLSPFLALIDPYFRPEEPRWMKPVREFLSHVPELTQLEIHTCNPKDCSKEHIERAYRQHLLPILAESPTVRVCVWAQEKALHDRFLLNSRGGYKFGRGLDEKPGEKVSIDLLEETAWSIRIREYHVFDKQEQEDDPHLAFAFESRGGRAVSAR